MQEEQHNIKRRVGRPHEKSTIATQEEQNNMRGGARQCKRSSEVVHKEHRSRGEKNNNAKKDNATT
jgi:hypothetical protein